MEPLTQEEQNLLKDILHTIGRDDTLNVQFANACGMTEMQFDGVTDHIFKKLENGRVTFDTGGANRLI